MNEPPFKASSIPPLTKGVDDALQGLFVLYGHNRETIMAIILRAMDYIREEYPQIPWSVIDNE